MADNGTEDPMYLIRDTMHCKPGKVREMIKRFKSLNELSKKVGLPPSRIMTDVSGEQFWTIVGEFEVESLDEFYRSMEKAFTDPQAAQIMSGYHEMVEGGRREIYKVEQ
jgi:hypothetical protein